MGFQHYSVHTTDTLQDRQQQQQQKLQIVLVLSLIHSFCLLLHLFPSVPPFLTLSSSTFRSKFFCCLSPLRRSSMHDYRIVFSTIFYQHRIVCFVKALLQYMCICIFFLFHSISVCVCVCVLFVVVVVFLQLLVPFHLNKGMQ